MQSIEDSQAAHQIRWKLPTSPANEVRRVELVDALCGPSGTRMNLIHAPAGFGKTSLMLQCRARLAASGVKVVWLRFDTADNDGARFAASIDDAVSRTLAAPHPTSRSLRARSDLRTHSRASYGPWTRARLRSPCSWTTSTTSPGPTCWTGSRA